jgi:hypothetical protein
VRAWRWRAWLQRAWLLQLAPLQLALLLLAPLQLALLARPAPWREHLRNRRQLPKPSRRLNKSILKHWVS